MRFIGKISMGMQFSRCLKRDFCLEHVEEVSFLQVLPHEILTLFAPRIARQIVTKENKMLGT